MIDLQQAYVRAYLEGIARRVATAGEALDWLSGKPTLDPAELAPGFDTTVPDETLQAFIRLAGTVQTFGPRAVTLRRTGAIGIVNWGGDNKVTDQRLTDLKLEALALRAHKALFATGITAFWTHVPPGTTDARLQVLGGYLEPLYDPLDPAGEIVALYQVLPSPAGSNYRVRIYDFSEGLVREWENLNRPYNIAAPPTNVYENQLAPVVVLADVDQDGFPIGEGVTALPLLKQELSTQLRIIRNSQTHAFGMYAFTGEWQLPTQLGPTQVLLGEVDGTVQRLAPGELAPLFDEHDRILERLRADLRLPFVALTGGDFPSGEAITQANQAFISACRADAALLSTGLTQAVEDFAALAGITPAPVSVEINREALRKQILEDARDDYAAGIISFRMAATAASAYYPTASVDELEEFIAQRELAEQQPNPNPDPGLE